MDRAVVERWVRVFISMFYGTIAVLILLLWVRSYDWFDRFYGYPRFGRQLELGSSPGHVSIILAPFSATTFASSYPEISSRPAEYFRRFMRSGAAPAATNFPATFFVGRYQIVAPHWAFALAFAIAAFAPWARYVGPSLTARYSLRTMLIATTLVAVMLGLGVWLSR